MKIKKQTIIGLLLFAPFLFSGCFTAKYFDEVVSYGRYDYCKRPFEPNNHTGYYIGTQDYGGSPYDVFVFKNLIKTDDDKYVKIALPHNEDDWHWHDYRIYRIPRRSGDFPLLYDSNTPQEFEFSKSEKVPAEGLIVSECDAEDFDEEKSLASAHISPAYMNKKVLFLTCEFYSDTDKKYQFAFFVSQKKVMKIYHKRRSFPLYVFTVLGCPGPILLDTAILPLEILFWCALNNN